MAGGGQMCILFVEDEPIIAMVAAEALEDAGHQVITAATGDAAATYLDSMPGHFAGLVTDFTMPGELTGVDVIYRTWQTYPEMPMVLATAIAHTISRPWLKHQRVTLVSKPYSLATLVDLVKNLLADCKK